MREEDLLCGTDLRLSIVLITVRQTYQLACIVIFTTLKNYCVDISLALENIFCAAIFWLGNISHYRSRAAERFYLDECDLCGSDWSPLVTICTASLTFTNSAFCPNSVFMSFVWIWDQTAIISLYSINWLVFITDTQCVYCAVRTGSLNVKIC